MWVESYNPRDRYRQRTTRRMTGAIAFGGVMLLAGAIGFWLGRQHAAQEVMTLTTQADVLTQQRNVLQDTVTELRTQTQTANLRYEQLSRQMAEAMPQQGPVRVLNELVRQQIEKGVDPERLAFVLRSARPPNNCTDPETKRFVVSNPGYQGPVSTVALAEGGITISGSGTSARSKSGGQEAWYDPSQPVTLVFAISGQPEERKSGLLPLQHSVVYQDREYRFTIAEGAKSFAKVTFDSCDYP